MYKLNKIINKTKMFFILSSLGAVIITVASQDPRDKVIAQMSGLIDKQNEVMNMMMEVINIKEEAKNQRNSRECEVKIPFFECTCREGKGGNPQSSETSETSETSGTSSWNNLRAALDAVSDASKQIGQAIEPLVVQTSSCTLS